MSSVAKQLSLFSSSTNRMIRLLPFFTLLLISTRIFPQHTRGPVDSLLKVEANAKQDGERLQAVKGLCNAFYSIRQDSFFIYCRKGIALARSLGRKPDLIALNLKMVEKLTDTGNYALAMKYGEESLEMARKMNAKPLIIDCYTNIGLVYDYQSDFVRSSEFFYKAWDIAKEINDHQRLAMLGTDLSAAACNQRDYKKAESLAIQTCKEAEIAHAPYHLYKGYYILALAESGAGDTAAAEINYRQAIETCKRNNFVLYEAFVISDLAMLQKMPGDKIRLLLDARHIFDSLSPASFESRINWHDLGQAYFEGYRSDPTKIQFLDYAERYLNKLLEKSQETSDRAEFADGLQLMAGVQAAKRHYKEAYEDNILYHAINDSIFSQENKNKIAALESRNEMDKKNREIENQRRQVAEQKKNVYLLVGGLLLVSAIGLLFFRVSAIRKQKNKELSELNRQLDDANQLKMKFFGILSHDLRGPIANLVNFLTLQKIDPHALTKDEKEAHEDKIGASVQGLLETMENMLLWSKSQMEQFKPAITVVQVSQLFTWLRKNFSDTGHVAISCSAPDDLDLRTDADYLQTIMYNLTANAMRALRQKTDGLIEWKAWREAGQLFFSISDNGPGASDEQLRALYDESAPSGARTGLGLHIIRDLAKAIGCRVTYKAGISAGAEFVLSMSAA